jgi:hypothetical protein
MQLERVIAEMPQVPDLAMRIESFSKRNKSKGRGRNEWKEIKKAKKANCILTSLYTE